MQIRFSDGPMRWAWTEGLGALGQQDFAVTLPWQKGDARDEQMRYLLGFIGEYIAGQPRRIVAGQTMEFGWSRLRFAADEAQGRLVIEELRDDAPGEPVYVAGASRSIALKALQNEALRRNRITGDAEFPQRSKTAIVCSRVTPETIGTLRPLGVQRIDEPEGHFSGWFLSCTEDGHDHDDADELEQVHLLHLVAAFPGLFPYLAMPVGTALLFGAEQVMVFGPGEQYGHVDAAPLLRALP